MAEVNLRSRLKSIIVLRHRVPVFLDELLDNQACHVEEGRDKIK